MDASAGHPAGRGKPCIRAAHETSFTVDGRDDFKEGLIKLCGRDGGPAGGRALPVAPETGAGRVGRLDEMSHLDFASFLAIPRFRLPRDPRDLIRPSLE